MNPAIVHSRKTRAKNGEKTRFQIAEGKYLDHMYLILMYVPNPFLVILTLQELIRSARDEQALDGDGRDVLSEGQKEGITTERQAWPKRPRGENASAGDNRTHKKPKK